MSKSPNPEHSRAQPAHSIELRDQGEELVYTRGPLEVFLSRTYCDGHRLYLTDCEVDSQDQPISAGMRVALLEHLCEHFDSRRATTILVVDEEDRDRTALEARIDALIADGHRLQLEWDSALLRAAAVDEMYLSIIASDSELSIEGILIDSPERYWEWKSTRTRAG